MWSSTSKLADHLLHKGFLDNHLTSFRLFSFIDRYRIFQSNTTSIQFCRINSINLVGLYSVLHSCITNRLPSYRLFLVRTRLHGDTRISDKRSYFVSFTMGCDRRKRNCSSWMVLDLLPEMWSPASKLADHILHKGFSDNHSTSSRLLCFIG